MGDPPFKDAAFISHGRPKGASGHPLTLFSDASLESVVHASVFRRKLVRPSQPDKYYCTGILFTYQSGGKRAVGECRIGVDGCVDYEKPVEMFYDHFSVGLAEWRPKSSSGGQQPVPGGGGGVECVYVKFRTEKGKEVGTKDLIRGRKRPMAGHVGFWMAKYDTFMSFSPDTEGEGVGEGGPAAGGGQGDEVVGGEGPAAGGGGQGDGSPGEIGGSDSQMGQDSGSESEDEEVEGEDEEDWYVGGRHWAKNVWGMLELSHVHFGLDAATRA